MFKSSKTRSEKTAVLSKMACHVQYCIRWIKMIKHYRNTRASRHQILVQVPNEQTAVEPIMCTTFEKTQGVCPALQLRVCCSCCQTYCIEQCRCFVHPFAIWAFFASVHHWPVLLVVAGAPDVSGLVLHPSDGRCEGLCGQGTADNLKAGLCSCVSGHGKYGGQSSTHI